MIQKIIEHFKIRYYHKLLEKYVGRKLPNVKVMGPLYFENGSLIIGDNCVFYPGVMFAGNGQIEIGDGCKIGKDVVLYARKQGGIIIGDNTIIAAQCYLIDSNHSTVLGKQISQQPLVSKRIIVGNDVWIAADVTVIPGANIKNGAVIGAKSLVNNTIHENMFAYGIPANEVRRGESDE